MCSEGVILQCLGYCSPMPRPVSRPVSALNSPRVATNGSYRAYEHQMNGIGKERPDILGRSRTLANSDGVILGASCVPIVVLNYQRMPMNSIQDRLFRTPLRMVILLKPEVRQNSDSIWVGQSKI